MRLPAFEFSNPLCGWGFGLIDGGFLGALLSKSALKCWDEIRRGVYRSEAEIAAPGGEK